MHTLMVVKSSRGTEFCLVEHLPLSQQMHRCRILVRKFLSKVRFKNGEYVCFRNTLHEWK